MSLYYPQHRDHASFSPEIQHAHTFFDSQPRGSLFSSSPINKPLSQRSSQLHLSSMSTSQLPSNLPYSTYPSTPSPDYAASSKADQGNSAQGAKLDNGWPAKKFSSCGYLEANQYHKRLSSDSSIDSPGPPSPRRQRSPRCQVVTSDSPRFSSLENFGCMSHSLQNHASKPLPTPVGTPTSQSLMPSSYGNISTVRDQYEHPSLASRNVQPGMVSGTAASMVMSGPPSASSMSHTSPVTPGMEIGSDQNSKIFAQGPIHSDAYAQALRDVFPDQIYQVNPASNFTHPNSSGLPHGNSHLQSYKDMHMFASQSQSGSPDHVAQRTSSSAAEIVTDRPPFKSYQDVHESGQDTSRPVAMTAATQAMMEQSLAPAGTTSVSPKELMRDDADFHTENNTAMFPVQFDQGPMFANRGTRSNMRAFPMPDSVFGATSFPSSSTALETGHYPFMSNQRRRVNNAHHESEVSPEFPAHLVSMETTVEEGPAEASSSQSGNQTGPAEEITRPDDTSSDLGTYTCTYHGCTLRFDSPARLQKHKRDAHRQSSPGAGPTSAPTGPTSAGSRSSQAGPHKCDRTNPSTGKSCNSIFSRPYDLTRHEDTIHNARKHKVRCHLCREEKTFSRNDALTRHMRVVHPDVDWPGKLRRGKGSD